MNIERFAGMFPSVVDELLRRLDRNFQRLAQTTGPYVVASSYTFKNEDQIDSLQVDATAGAITIYLPSSPTGSRRRRVIKTDASANAVTVDGNGATINGAATVVLAAQYDRVTVEATGTAWLRID